MESGNEICCICGQEFSILRMCAVSIDGRWVCVCKSCSPSRWKKWISTARNIERSYKKSRENF